MSAANWLEELEAQLDSFLRTNPQQQALLEEQHRRDRQTRLLNQRLKLRQEAEQQRQGLLGLAGEIRQWQERVERARAAGAGELASRAEAHIASLMERGRSRWQSLGELGQRFQALEEELQQLSRPAPSPAGAAPAGTPSPSGADSGREASGASDLESAWSRFEAQQELEQLRRRHQS